MANIDILRTLTEFIAPKQYVFLAPVSKVWREAWGKRPTVNCLRDTRLDDFTASVQPRPLQPAAGPRPGLRHHSPR